MSAQKSNESSKGVVSPTPVYDLDEPSRLELEIAEKQSKLNQLQSWPMAALIMVAVFIFFGLTFALFGRSLLQEFPNNIYYQYAPLWGFGFIGMALYAFGFSSVLRRNNISTLKQELDVLIAKRKILNRSASGSAETTPEHPVSYFDQLVDINVTNLGAYYTLVKVHTNNSFLVTIVVGSVGFALIFVGLSVGFTNNTNAQTITYVASASGVITEFIAGIFFYLYNRTVRQMKEYHDSLLAVQNILLSFKIVGDTKDDIEKAKMVSSMLAYLVSNQAGAVKSRGGEAKKEDS